MRLREILVACSLTLLMSCVCVFSQSVYFVDTCFADCAPNADFLCEIKGHECVDLETDFNASMGSIKIFVDEASYVEEDPNKKCTVRAEIDINLDAKEFDAVPSSIFQVKFSSGSDDSQNKPECVTMKTRPKNGQASRGGTVRVISLDCTKDIQGQHIIIEVTGKSSTGDFTWHSSNLESRYCFSEAVRWNDSHCHLTNSCPSPLTFLKLICDYKWPIVAAIGCSIAGVATVVWLVKVCKPRESKPQLSCVNDWERGSQYSGRTNSTIVDPGSLLVPGCPPDHEAVQRDLLLWNDSTSVDSLLP